MRNQSPRTRTATRTRWRAALIWDVDRSQSFRIIEWNSLDFANAYPSTCITSSHYTDVVVRARQLFVFSSNGIIPQWGRWWYAFTVPLLVVLLVALHGRKDFSLVPRPVCLSLVHYYKYHRPCRYSQEEMNVPWRWLDDWLSNVANGKLN